MLSLLQMQTQIYRLSWNLQLGQSEHAVISCNQLADKCYHYKIR